MGQTNREKRKAAKKKARARKTTAGWSGNPEGHSDVDAMNRELMGFLSSVYALPKEKYDEEIKWVHDLIEANKRAGYPDCDEMFGVPDDHFAAMPDDFKRELYSAAKNVSVSRVDRFRSVFALSAIGGFCLPMNVEYLEVADA